MNCAKPRTLGNTSTIMKLQLLLLHVVIFALAATVLSAQTNETEASNRTALANEVNEKAVNLTEPEPVEFRNMSSLEIMEPASNGTRIVRSALMSQANLTVAHNETEASNETRLVQSPDKSSNNETEPDIDVDNKNRSNNDTVTDDADASGNETLKATGKTHDNEDKNTEKRHAYPSSYYQTYELYQPQEPQQQQQQEQQQQQQQYYQTYGVNKGGYTGSAYAINEERAKLQQYQRTIPGVPGQDYPILYAVPQTGFQCPGLPGLYGDDAARCQSWHFCQEGGKMDSFLCPNGSLFNQQYLVCDWWYNVDCQLTRQYYVVNQRYNELYGYRPGFGYNKGYDYQRPTQAQQVTTYRPIEVPTYRPVEVSTYRPVVVSTYRPVEVSTYRPVEVTTPRPVYPTQPTYVIPQVPRVSVTYGSQKGEYAGVSSTTTASPASGYGQGSQSGGYGHEVYVGTYGQGASSDSYGGQGAITITYGQGGSSASQSQGSSAGNYGQGVSSGTQGVASATYEQGSSSRNYEQSGSSGSYGQGASSTTYVKGTSGSYGQGSASSGYGQGSASSGYGQGSASSGYGQGSSSSGYGQGSSSSGYGQGSASSGYGQGSASSGYGQGSASSGYEQGSASSGYGQSSSTSGSYGKGSSSAGSYGKGVSSGSSYEQSASSGSYGHGGSSTIYVIGSAPTNYGQSGSQATYGQSASSGSYGSGSGGNAAQGVSSVTYSPVASYPKGGSSTVYVTASTPSTYVSSTPAPAYSKGSSSTQQDYGISSVTIRPAGSPSVTYTKGSSSNSYQILNLGDGQSAATGYGQGTTITRDYSKGDSYGQGFQSGSGSVTEKSASRVTYQTPAPARYDVNKASYGSQNQAQQKGTRYEKFGYHVAIGGQQQQQQSSSYNQAAYSQQSNTGTRYNTGVVHPNPTAVTQQGGSGYRYVYSNVAQVPSYLPVAPTPNYDTVNRHPSSGNTAFTTGPNGAFEYSFSNSHPGSSSSVYQASYPRPGSAVKSGYQYPAPQAPSRAYSPVLANLDHLYLSNDDVAGTGDHYLGASGREGGSPAVASAPASTYVQDQLLNAY